MTRRVTLVRTGGVGGLRIEKTVDAKDLSGGEAAAVEACLAAPPRAVSGPKETASAPRSPDRFCYTLTVEEDGRSRSASFREGEEPAALGPLIASLRGISAGRTGPK